VVGFPGSEPITNEDLLTLDVTVLIPAALGEVIHHKNADDVSANVIVEAANNPVTPFADEILGDRGVTVVPDILANAGGVTVSYYEWVQNFQQIRWTEEDVNKQLSQKLRTAYLSCRDFNEAHPQSQSLREAAFALAVERVVEAARLRGYL
jgi:glutamate dehydrogenase (NAD(P)+)